MKVKLFITTLIVCSFVPISNFSKEITVINQVGYLPNIAKYVFTIQPADSFYVIDSSSQNICFSGKLELWKMTDPSTELSIYRGDFSNFQKSGTYFIRTAGGDISHPFQISNSVYEDTYKKALKGFYFQRCGLILKSDYAGVYYHPRCHIADAFFHESSDTSGFKHTIGGWHDAGDFGKYVVNAGITVGTLLMAYELFPNCFDQDDIGIPESGNGIPDILDETRYELEWLLKMQGPNGGVYTKLTTEKFAPMIMPHEGDAMRFIYQIASTATADFAAVMAKAARIYQSFDGTFTDTCLKAADKAWNWLEKHLDIVPPGGFQNPDGTETGEYGDTNDSDERLWASAELFLTTAENKYHSYYVNNYNQQDLISGPMGWQNVKTLAHLAYLNGSANGINSTIQSQIYSSLVNYCQNLVSDRDESGFHVLLNPGEYFWGSNSQVLNKAILLIICFEKVDNSKFIEIAFDQLHYILGINAHDMTFVTGIGEKSPMHPHHRPSIADGVEDPVPGLLVGGPNQYLQDPTLQAHFNSSTPPALCYIDDVGSWASNEIAINWNASLVFVSGYFSKCFGDDYINSTGETFPGKIELFQNYPNPFNNRTTIRFSLEAKQSIDLVIFNTLGDKVFERDLGTLSPGFNDVDWSGIDQSGNNLSSGIYLYYLKGGQNTSVRKLVLLK